MKKRELKKTGLSLVKFQVTKLENLRSIKGGSEANQILDQADDDDDWTWGG